MSPWSCSIRALSAWQRRRSRSDHRKGDQHAEYRRRQALDDRRRLFLSEILAMKGASAENPNSRSRLLKHSRLRGINYRGNLDRVLFQHDQQ
jgi:hypothetical protein